MNSITKEFLISIENAYKLYKDKVSKDTWRLKYHIMPPIGWLNDPNGVCKFNGEYYVYYQYSPLSPSGSLKYWGLYKSKDLIQWDDMGVVLYPDEKYDMNGVYSGSAIEKDGKLHYFYTGNVKNPGDYDYITNGREHNQIHAVSGDGINIKKADTVIKDGQYPDGFTKHIRDPKVWKSEGIYYMVLGARDNKDRGQILLYKSTDLYSWEYVGVPAGPIDGMGFMWECPNFINYGDKDVLLISPQGIKPEGDLYNNIYQSGYMVGKLDLDNCDFIHGDFIEIDRGFDFYAPQIFKDDNGRVIMFGWMGLPDIDKEYYTNPTKENGWQHAMTIPRELILKEDKLIQKPVKELKKLRKNEIINNIKITEHTFFDGISGEIYELEVVFINLKSIEITLRKDAKLKYNCMEKRFVLSLGKSGYGRKERAVYIEELKNITVFSDSSSLEIFLNNGQEVLTTRIYPDLEDKLIKFEGEAELKIKKWDL